MNYVIAAGGWCAPTDSFYAPSHYRVDLIKRHWCVQCDENSVTSRGLTCTPCWHLGQVEAAIRVVHSGGASVDRDVAVRLLVEVERLRGIVERLDERP